MKRERTFKLIVHLFLILISVITLFPVIYTFIGSFKTNGEILAHPDKFLPESFRLDNYIAVFNADEFDIVRLLKNSVIYTVAVVLIQMTIATINAYVFERGKFRGKNAIFTVFTSLMFINMGSITVYALFDVLTFIHVPISLWGLVLIKFLGIPIINIFLIREYISSIPKELDEAAKIDGCTFMQTFTQIILPLLKPILVTVGILGFQGSWNDYLMPAVFTTAIPEQRTLMVGLMALKSSGDAAGAWNLMLAGSVISLLPILVVFLFANKYFINGITSGAVKG